MLFTERKNKQKTQQTTTKPYKQTTWVKPSLKYNKQ